MNRILKFISFIIFSLILTLPISAELPQEVKAIWVTRWDYTSPDDIRKIIDNASNHHFNMILFQVRGNGTVYYPSKHEPWAEILGSSDPGWNPLQEAIKYAKNQNIQLHAWINVYPAWRGIDPPSNPDHFYNTHPDWLMVDADGKSMQLSSHYVWNNPANPEVQSHLTKIVLELAEIPGLDGVHFDYFRYPGPGYSFDDKTLKTFYDVNKRQPSESTKLWNQYRRDGITNWLRNVYHKIKHKKPNFQISSAVIGDYDLGTKVFFQDSHQWLTEGIIDFIFPMTYTNDIRMLQRWLLRHAIHQRRERIFPGLMVYPDMELLQNEIQLVRDKGFAGFSVFAYRSLFPNHQAIEKISVLQPNIRSSSTPDQVEKPATGIVISEIRWFPEHPSDDDSIRIVCKIEGLKNNSPNQAFLIWKAESSKNSPPRLNMVRMKSKPQYWYSKSKIPPQKTGETILLRAFVGNPNKNIKRMIASDRRTIIIDVNKSEYKSEGKFGPLLTLVTRGVVDLNNRAWLLEPGKGIRIIEADGTEASFSPVNSFTDADGDSQNFTIVSGITLLPNNTIAVTVLKNSIPILLTNNQVQSSLSMKFQMPISGVDLASSSDGILYILNIDGWVILNPIGIKIGKEPFPQIHTVNNIAVSADGRHVFVACRTEGAVHHWIGFASENTASYKQVQDLDVFNISLGSVTIGANGFIYLAETPSGIVRILDQNLNIFDILSKGKPGLTAPRLVLPSSDSSFLYVIETGGTTPIRMRKFLKIKTTL